MPGSCAHTRLTEKSRRQVPQADATVPVQRECEEPPDVLCNQAQACGASAGGPQGTGRRPADDAAASPTKLGGAWQHRRARVS